MLSTVDHPLNQTGYTQASALGQAIRAALDDPRGEQVRDHRVTTVYPPCTHRVTTV